MIDSTTRYILSILSREEGGYLMGDPWNETCVKAMVRFHNGWTTDKWIPLVYFSEAEGAFLRNLHDLLSTPRGDLDEFPDIQDIDIVIGHWHLERCEADYPPALPWTYEGEHYALVYQPSPYEDGQVWCVDALPQLSQYCDEPCHVIDTSSAVNLYNCGEKVDIQGVGEYGGRIAHELFFHEDLPIRELHVSHSHFSPEWSLPHLRVLYMVHPLGVPDVLTAVESITHHENGEQPITYHAHEVALISRKITFRDCTVHCHTFHYEGMLSVEETQEILDRSTVEEFYYHGERQW